MTSLGRRPLSSAATQPLEDDDLLSEILLVLPPQPSSLPRASVVCKRWHRIVTDPRFICRFRRHHRRNPPLIGFFDAHRGISFRPTLEAPNRVPPARFSLQLDGEFRLLNSRHGLVLFLNKFHRKVLVWDPVTGDQHSFAIPTAMATVFEKNKFRIQGAVLRAAGEVHHFQVVLAVGLADQDGKQLLLLACVYSSEIGVWGKPISTPLPPVDYKDLYYYGVTNVCMHSVLVGDSIYWPLNGNPTTNSYILECDLGRQSLAMIKLPVDMSQGSDLTPMRAEGGGLGFLVLSNSDFSAELWKRKTNCDGLASWVLGATIKLDKLFPLNSEKKSKYLMLIGFAEYSNVVFLWTHVGPCMVDLELLQFKEFDTNNLCYPFESVYAVPAISKQLIL